MKLYGTIKLSRSKWRIDCEPHVRLRIKRFFGKVARSQMGTIVLSDTEENCRDIVWLCERYPMAIDDEHVRERLYGRARDYDEGISLVDAMLSGARPAPDVDLAIPARNYQRVAALAVIKGLTTPSEAVLLTALNDQDEEVTLGW